jgi:hypothetical protein
LREALSSLGLPDWLNLGYFADGNWFDIASLLVAIVYALYRWGKCKGRYKLITRTTGFDVLNGVSLFP